MGTPLDSYLNNNPDGRGVIRDILTKASGDITQEGIWCAGQWFFDAHGVEKDGVKLAPTGYTFKPDEIWAEIEKSERNLSLVAQMSRCAEGSVHLVTAQLGHTPQAAAAAISLVDDYLQGLGGSNLVGFNDQLSTADPHEAAKKVADVFYAAADRL